MYNALVQAFAIPGPQNMSALKDMITQSKQKFKVSGRCISITSQTLITLPQDNTVLGNFLGNQDLPRWHNFSVDPQSLWNAMTFNFMSDGYVLFPLFNDELASHFTRAVFPSCTTVMSKAFREMLIP